MLLTMTTITETRCCSGRDLFAVIPRRSFKPYVYFNRMVRTAKSPANSRPRIDRRANAPSIDLTCSCSRLPVGKAHPTVNGCRLVVVGEQEHRYKGRPLVTTNCGAIVVRYVAALS